MRAQSPASNIQVLCDNSHQFSCLPPPRTQDQRPSVRPGYLSAATTVSDSASYPVSCPFSRPAHRPDPQLASHLSICFPSSHLSQTILHQENVELVVRDSRTPISSWASDRTYSAADDRCSGCLLLVIRITPIFSLNPNYDRLVHSKAPKKVVF
jgi:hypothetical protein